ncbi:hypothetical protein KN1_13340 [Stygiolobus caldivivus]|uniref:Uncharacterized protein n=1 Tax=Stygiolobus caldivivus TaxID=2824673 RepID=A0A8D5ZJC9_9CREN|nr:hypothetical protein [Stygiolobus caldivivus]BCU70037.1 hypothetical protein KN1_13340 [Stygiolobus caldivivus]
MVPVIVAHELVWFLEGMGLEDRLGDITAYSQHRRAEVVYDCGDHITGAIEVLKKEKTPRFGL